MGATLIAAPSSTQNAEGERDPEMKQAKKGNRWYFDMKARIAVPVIWQKSGLKVTGPLRSSLGIAEQHRHHAAVVLPRA